jgi:hypothetical protein
MFTFDCSTCLTRCDGKTVAQFDFEKDVAFSERIENAVIKFINQKYPLLSAKKTEQVGYPDIEISLKNEVQPCAFVEIKGQARTFMAVTRILKASKLQPSETIALNLSDLERYFAIKDKEKLPIYVIWCVFCRPCVLQGKEKRFFYQEIDILKEIRQADKFDARKYRRASGKGDVVAGKHKGVVVNYHFSLHELVLGLPDFSKLVF